MSTSVIAIIISSLTFAIVAFKFFFFELKINAQVKTINKWQKAKLEKESILEKKAEIQLAIYNELNNNKIAVKNIGKAIAKDFMINLATNTIGIHLFGNSLPIDLEPEMIIKIDYILPEGYNQIAEFELRWDDEFKSNNIKTIKLKMS